MLEKLFRKAGMMREEKKPTPEVIASTAREGTNRLSARIARLVLKDKSGKIPEETMDACKTILRGLQTQLDNAPTIVTDTGRMDESLIDIADSLEKAVAIGKIATVREIMEMLNKGIGELRNTIEQADDYEKMKRISILEKQATLARLLVLCDEIEAEVEKEEETLGQMKESYREAHKIFKEYSQEHPELEKEMDEQKGKPGPIPAHLLSYSVQMQYVVHAANKVISIKRIKALNEVSLQSRRKAVDTLRNELMAVSNEINPKILEEMNRYHKEFEKELLRIRTNNQQIDEIQKQFTDMMDTYFNDPYFENFVIETEGEYRALIKKLEEEEKRIKVALEQAQKPKELEHDEPTRQLLTQ